MGWRAIRPRGLAWRYAATWVASLVLIWTTYFTAHDAVVHSMDDDLQRRMESETLVLEDHASRAVDGVTSSLDALAALSSDDEILNSGKFSRKLRDLHLDDTILRSLSLVDPQGRIVSSSNMSNVGQAVSEAVMKGLGPAPSRPRSGIRFSGALVQRDLPDQTQARNVAQSIWLAQTDVRSDSLVGYRWVAAINSGFFVNFWAAANKRNDVQVGLYDYEGRQLVSLGTGPAASESVTLGLQASLNLRDSGDLVAQGLGDWRIRYRASSRHPLVFVMFAERAHQAQLQFKRTAALRWSAFGGSLLATVVIGLLYYGSRRYRHALSMSTRLQQLAQTDPLTGIANRRAFDELAPAELRRAGALGQSLSLLVIDMDHFKSINDRFGHPAGDAVLRTMAERWHRTLRSGDLLVRAGGEEFLVLLPRTGCQQAQAVAMKLIEETRREPVVLAQTGTALPVTVSMGVLGIDECPPDADIDALVAAADEALYRAKEGGRDRFVATEWPKGVPNAESSGSAMKSGKASSDISLPIPTQRL